MTLQPLCWRSMKTYALTIGFYTHIEMRSIFTSTYLNLGKRFCFYSARLTNHYFLSNFRKIITINGYIEIVDHGFIFNCCKCAAV